MHARPVSCSIGGGGGQPFHAPTRALLLSRRPASAEKGGGTSGPEARDRLLDRPPGRCRLLRRSETSNSRTAGTLGEAATTSSSALPRHGDRRRAFFRVT